MARLAVRVLPQRQARCVQLLRHAARPSRPDAREESVRRELRRSACQEQGVLLRQLRRAAPDDRPDAGDQRARRQRAQRHHQRRERRRQSSHCAGAAVVPAADAADAGAGGAGHRPGRHHERNSCRRELLRRPLRLHDHRDRPTCSSATRRTWRRCSSRTRARRFRCGTATTRRAITTSRRNSRQIVKPTMANTLRFGATRTQEQASAHRSRQRAARVLSRVA